MGEQKVGEVFRYFDKVMVAGVKITDGSLSIGDTVRIKGATTDFKQKVDSIQIDRNPIQKAIAGQQVGLKVSTPVKPGDTLYKVTG